MLLALSPDVIDTSKLLRMLAKYLCESCVDRTFSPVKAGHLRHNIHFHNEMLLDIGDVTDRDYYMLDTQA